MRNLGNANNKCKVNIRASTEGERLINEQNAKEVPADMTSHRDMRNWVSRWWGKGQEGGGN